jgi:hypothetical protein
MNSALRRATVALALAGVTIVAPAAVASASTPVMHACVGTTFSGNATSLLPGAVGATVKGFAQEADARPGIGDGIALLQAGLVDDSTVANTCNG